MLSLAESQISTPPSQVYSVQAAQNDVARSLHASLDNLCTGPLATKASVAGKAELDLIVIDRLLAQCSRDVTTAAADEAGVEHSMDEVNAAVQGRLGQNWKVMISRQTGEPFYHNSTTGATFWDRPDTLTADGLGLELSPEVITHAKMRTPSSRMDSSEGGDHPPSLLEAVRQTVSQLPRSSASERVDVSRIVGGGLTSVAEAVDAFVVARSGCQGCAASAQESKPFTAEAVGATLAAGRVMAEPEVAWLLKDPSSEIKAEVVQLKALLSLASATVGAAAEPLTPHYSLAAASHSANTSLPSAAEQDKTREISRMCRHILASSADKAPESLPTKHQRATAASVARERLHAIRENLEAESKLGGVGEAYDVRALEADLRKLSSCEDALKEQHNASMARLGRERGAALELADGFGKREKAVNDLLSFALAFALRNRRCAERASSSVASCEAQAAVLKGRLEQDMAALDSMRTVLGRDRREASLVAQATTAFEKWRFGVFRQLDEQLQRHGSDECAVRDHAEYVRCLQSHSFALQQLRGELSRLCADVASTLQPLRERLLEVDTRFALTSWMDNTSNHNDDDDGYGYGSPGNGGGGYGVAVQAATAGGNEDLSLVRRAVQSAIEERTKCVEDLEAVMEDMDARLAQRVWSRDGGIVAHHHHHHLGSSNDDDGGGSRGGGGSNGGGGGCGGSPNSNRRAPQLDYLGGGGVAFSPPAASSPSPSALPSSSLFQGKAAAKPLRSSPPSSSTHRQHSSYDQQRAEFRQQCQLPEGKYGEEPRTAATAERGASPSFSVLAYLQTPPPLPKSALSVGGFVSTQRRQQHLPITPISSSRT